MKNTKKIVAILLVSVLGFSSLTSVSASDFDCTTIDRDSMQELMQKVKNWDTLTTSESELLENSKECKPEWKRGGKWKMNWEKTEMSDEQKDNKNTMKSIIEKQENWETLTDDEQEKYDNHLLNKENKNPDNKDGKQKRKVNNLSAKSKTSINWTVNKVSKSYENLTDEQKIEKYEKLQTKLEEVLEKIENSSKYNDTKKSLFEDIINELLNQLDDKIEELK
jgi:hypothetical protein